MNKWSVVLIVLAGLYLIGSLIAAFAFGDKNSFNDKIVIVPVEGEIGTSSSGGFFSSTSGVSSKALVKTIKELDKDKSVKGVIFEINSPGGSVVASQEIADAVANMNKTNYAVIREVGASGAYWIASASDKIISSRMSITGSIGVYGSYLEFSKLFEEYGVGYERLISGKYKDLGVPYRDLSDEEKNLLQKKLNMVHEFFINEVAKNRNMDVNDIKTSATGEFFLGDEAKKLGLIDEFGNVESAVDMMKKELNITEIEIIEKKEESSILDIFMGNAAYHFGRGFGSSILENKNINNFKIST